MGFESVLESRRDANTHNSGRRVTLTWAFLKRRSFKLKTMLDLVTRKQQVGLGRTVDVHVFFTLVTSLSPYACATEMTAPWPPNLTMTTAGAAVSEEENQPGFYCLWKGSEHGAEGCLEGAWPTLRAYEEYRWQHINQTSCGLATCRS